MQTNFIIKNKNPRIKSLGDNITSHHTLTAFFSGQDVKMIQQEGNDTNCFVSLVVDTRGQYVAVVTRKVQTKSEVTIKNLGTSYEFFGEGTKTLTSDETKTTKVVDKEIIEYFDLQVERHEVPNTLEYLDARFDEIIRKKETTKQKDSTPWHIDDWQRQHNQIKLDDEPMLFDSKTMKSLETTPLTKEDNDKLNVIEIDWTPDAKLISQAASHIITCSLIVNYGNKDLGVWVNNHMLNIYKRTFGEGVLYECTHNTSGTFSEWKEFIIQWILDNFDTSDVPESLDYDVFLSRIASEIKEELLKYGEDNPFIGSYCKTLDSYITE